MNLSTQIEHDLFEYLSPEGKAEVEQHFAALEVDAPNECPNCGDAIGDHDSFCGDDCKNAWWGQDEFMMNRSKLEGQREDAGEHRQELIRMDIDRLREEAIELMVREPKVELDEDRLRDEENERRT